MPSIKNFPEVWKNRLVQKISSAIVAPWLNGVSEMEMDVIELGAGTASEKNILYVPTSMFEPDVLINNVDYPIPSQPYTDDQIPLSLDKYQTKVTTLSDDETIGASYPRIDNAIASHGRAIAKKKFMKAAHALSPVSNTAATPVVLTTGDLVNGRRRLTYGDLVTLRESMLVNDDEDGVVFVLCNEHWADLLRDRQNFGDQLINYRTGQPAPEIAGMKIFKYVANPFFNATTLARIPFGSAPAGTDKRASFAFVESNVAKKTGLTKQYFRPASIDPDNQTNRLNYRHYFMALPLTAAQGGAIVSATS